VRLTVRLKKKPGRVSCRASLLREIHRPTCSPGAGALALLLRPLELDDRA
jgi:hypothetical protein